MQKTINTKELRTHLPEIIRLVRRGQRFLVLHRSRRAFCVVPADEASVGAEDRALADEPLYRAGPVGRSADRRSSRDHDEILYGARSR